MRLLVVLALVATARLQQHLQRQWQQQQQQQQPPTA
jgi:hypothetical protein